MKNFTIIAILSMVATSCGLGSPLTPSSGSAEIASGLALCVGEVNHYRQTIGLPPLARSQSLEDFAASAAERDALAHTAHQYFLQTNGGGTARAETEILWWRGMQVGSVVQNGLAQMWLAGPSGEHYDILVGPYTEIGCGIFVNGGEVTVAQDFR